MKIKFKQITSPVEDSAELAATLMVGEGFPKGGVLSRFDTNVGGVLAKQFKKEKFKGKKGEFKLLPTYGIKKAAYLFVVGGRASGMDSLESARRFGGFVARKANALKVQSIAIEVPVASGAKNSAAESLQAVVEGIVLGSYRFNRYKSVKNEATITEVSFSLKKKLSPAAFSKAALIGEKKAEGTNVARDLVNTPPTDMTPTDLAKVAEKFAKLPGVSVKIYKKSDLVKMKMGGILAVGKGSSTPPVLIHLKYKGKKKKKIALIGKGITFDSGGINLKVGPGSHIEDMKYDMGGAAAVLGAFSTISALKPSVSVEGFVAAAENMPSGNANKPGDVLTMYSGKTVEVLNTDAEGRLVLADALFFANEQKPDVMIDMATLTGACVMALGEAYSGIMSNDSALVKKLQSNGFRSGEKLWELPLPFEYKPRIKSKIADLQNIGGRGAGTSIAGLFLQEFIGGHKSWAHLDIAGTAWTNETLPYLSKGGTGSMTRTLLQYILES